MLVWLLRDFDLLSVLLRALCFAFEALTLGGLLFALLVLAPVHPEPAAELCCRRRVAWASLGLLLAQAAAAAVSASVLIGGTGLSVAEVAQIHSFRAAELSVFSAGLLCVLLRLSGRVAVWACLFPASLLLGSAVAMSHAASRMDHRVLLGALTAVHHLGTAGWLGAMTFLLLALRMPGSPPWSRTMVERYSTLALFSSLSLVGAGLAMSWFYVGSWQGVYGTEYGLLLTAKTVLTAAMLGLGASNLALLRGRGAAQAVLGQLRQVSEAEIGLGFTILLAAASLTSQAPAVDVPGPDRASAESIAERVHWIAPRLDSPQIAQLGSHISSMDEAVRARLYSPSTSNAIDQAWSEYNHHWAGLIVLAAALVSLVARAAPDRGRLRTVANGWPLLFLALALFIVLRADPEAWPLGPRGFWESFAEPDALEHRVEAALLAGFAIFETLVRLGRLRWQRAGYVFPLLCAFGGAILLTHSHGMGNVREEVLADLSHLAIAVLGVLAGWARWLEFRLASPQPESSRLALAAWAAWTVCLLLVGLVLLDYRES